MSLLRYALFAFICGCYVTCQQNDDDTSKWVLDIFENTQDQNQIENKNDPNECICVKKSNCAITSKTPAVDPTTLFTLREKGCHYLEECCPPDKVIKTSTNPPPKSSTLCGISNPGGLVLREKAEQQSFADYAEFPWMVALLKKQQTTEWSNSDYIGGGSIIHPSVVITSAHKVDEYDANAIKCRAGEWDTNTIMEVNPHQERDVKKIVLHDEYLRLHAYNNVALLILTAPFTLAPNVGIACLGRTPPPLDAQCYSMGWGEDFSNKKKYAVILKRIQLPLVGQKQCEIFLRNTRLGSTYTLHKSLMCAGGEEGKDTCIGDGGSPLVCPIEQNDDDTSKWVLDIFENTQDQNQIENKNDPNECICVKKSNCAITSKTPAVDPTTLFTLREKGCHYLEECCPPDKVIKTSTNPPPKSSTLCGISNPGGLVLREKAEQQSFADYAEFPWMVALLKKQQTTEWSNSDYIGGGSIIHPSVVITSAHKVDEYDANAIKCRAGEWDTNTIMEVNPHQERDVKKIVLHDEYLRLHAYNNVALLILTAPFTLAPNVGIACLGRTPPPLDAQCYSMGWGEDFSNKKKYAVILKRIQLPLVGQKQCEIFLRNTRLGSTYTLHKSLMCAGGEEGKDTCIGDGGSPLVCPIENPEGDQLRYAVYGTVAYGVGCGVKDVPGVYVNVPEMYQWIARRIVLEGFTKTQFDY